MHYLKRSHQHSINVTNLAMEGLGHGKVAQEAALARYLVLPLLVEDIRVEEPVTAKVDVVVEAFEGVGEDEETIAAAGEVGEEVVVATRTRAGMEHQTASRARTRAEKASPHLRLETPRHMWRGRSNDQLQC